MIRPATLADLPALLAIRDAAGAERLSDPRRVTGDLLRPLVDAGAVWVWQAVADERVAGFAAVDVASGAVAALLVAPGEQGRGIGRALLAETCDALRAAGHAAATIAIEPGAAAERHYRAAGWAVIGTDANGASVFSKPLCA